jgi:hypothetical protein
MSCGGCAEHCLLPEDRRAGLVEDTSLAHYDCLYLIFNTLAAQMRSWCNASPLSGGNHSLAVLNHTRSHRQTIVRWGNILDCIWRTPKEPIGSAPWAHTSNEEEGIEEEEEEEEGWMTFTWGQGQGEERAEGMRRCKEARVEGERLWVREREREHCVLLYKRRSHRPTPTTPELFTHTATTPGSSQLVSFLRLFVYAPICTRMQMCPRAEWNNVHI